MSVLSYERSLAGLLGLDAPEYWRNRAAMAEAHARVAYAESESHKQQFHKTRGDLDKARHRIAVLEASLPKRSPDSAVHLAGLANETEFTK